MFRISLGLIAFVSMAAAASPLAGQLDTSFGNMDDVPGGGKVYTGFNLGGTKSDEGRAMARTRNGGILLAGIVPTGSGECLAMTRHTADGMPDESAWGGMNHLICIAGLLDGTDAGPYGLYRDIDLAIAASGDIYVVGTVHHMLERSTYLCHIREDGSPPPGQQAPDCVVLHAQQGEGLPLHFENEPTVLLRGEEVLVVTNPDRSTRPELFRVSRDTLTVTAQGPIIADSAPVKSAFAWDADIASNGDLVIAGEAVATNFTDKDYFAARYSLDDGSPALSFGGDGYRHIVFDQGVGNDNAYAVRALPGGDVVVAGRVEVAGSRYALGIVRLGVDGVIPESFNDGKGLRRFANYDANFEPWAIDETPSGKIVVAGMLEFPGSVIGSFAARMLADGSPDKDFQNGEAALFDFVPGKFEAAYGMLLQGERIVLGGTVDQGTKDFMLFRISDGRLFNDEFESAP